MDELVKRLREAPNDWPDADLHYEAADAIEELKQIVEHYKGCSDDWYKEACDYKSMLPHWIPVEEKPPNGNGEYLVSGNDKVWVCEFMILGNVGGWCNNARNPCVKYWMPLPEPPKGEN